MSAIGPRRHRSCGLVGMPNVGKSTLFNALTRTQVAQAANYPFCTIDPNEAVVEIPDPRLHKLAALVDSQRVVPTQIQFTDIAGLVKGASEGSGLGNKFLGHIRDTAVLLQVVRCFEDPDVTHVEETVDPLRDIAIIEGELILSDLESVERRLKTKKKAKGKGVDTDEAATAELLKRCFEVLDNGRPARDVLAAGAADGSLSARDRDLFSRLGLLSGKPMLYICNVDEDAAAGGNELSAAVREHAAAEAAAAQAVAGSGSVSVDDQCLVVCGSLESEISALDTAEARAEILEAYGLDSTGLDRVIQVSARLLGIQSFFTVGPQETRAWNVPAGATAWEAAGKIHSDIQRGFIRAETLSYDDYIACGSEAAAKAEGKLRLEGKDYVCQDGDVFNFRFNV